MFWKVNAEIFQSWISDQGWWGEDFVLDMD